MTPCLQIALLEPNELARTHLALALVRARLSVIECADVSALYEALDAHDASGDAGFASVPVIYVRQAAYAPSMLNGLLPHLRTLYGVAAVVGMCTELSKASPIPACADLCIDATRAAELLAGLDPLQLRIGQATNTESIAGIHVSAQAASPTAPDRAQTVCPDSARQMAALTLAESEERRNALKGDHPHSVEAYGTWKIAHKGWVIINPRGDHIALTGVERNFFEILLGSERHELSRDAVDPEQCGFALDSMSVLVSRLRKKIGASGCPLPLHTVHGLGYVFIGGLMRVHHASFAPPRMPGPATA